VTTSLVPDSAAGGSSVVGGLGEIGSELGGTVVGGGSGEPSAGGVGAWLGGVEPSAGGVASGVPAPPTVTTTTSPPRGAPAALVGDLAAVMLGAAGLVAGVRSSLPSDALDGPAVFAPGAASGAAGAGSVGAAVGAGGVGGDIASDDCAALGCCDGLAACL